MFDASVFIFEHRDLRSLEWFSGKGIQHLSFDRAQVVWFCARGTSGRLRRNPGRLLRG